MGDPGRPGKTGITDESVALDQAAWWPLWEALKTARPAGKTLWDFEVSEVRDAFNQAAEQLGLDAQPSLYVLRHSAASDDLLASRRTLPEVKDRGRWITDQSLRRYAKRTKLQQQVNSLADEVMQFGQLVDSNLVQLFEMAALGQPFKWPVPTLRATTSRGRVKPSLTTRWTAI